MTTGFEFYDESGSVQFSSESAAFLLLDLFDISGGVNGSKSYPNIPPGMTLMANWQPTQIEEHGSLGWSISTPKTNATIRITVSGNTVNWVWVNAANCNVSAAAIRVFAS